MFQDRRPAARGKFRDTQGSLSWDEDAGRITCEVTLLDITGEGAAVIADRLPALDRVVQLSLTPGASAMLPWDARMVATEVDASGRHRVRLRFSSWVSLGALFIPQQERRVWQRYPAKEDKAVLAWNVGRDEIAVGAKLLNISLGGAALLSPVEPPSDLSIRFGLEIEAERIDRVPAHVIAVSIDPSGSKSKIVRLRFLDLCPTVLFELAVHGRK